MQRCEFISTSDAATESELASLRAQLATATRERLAERLGRTRAEAALRAALSAAAQHAPASAAVFPLAPIGTLRSVFSRRSGTPRQPSLVPAALSELRLAPHVAAAALDGLADFSHVWLIYVFHKNTNLASSLGAPTKTVAATVRVPRLGGAKKGVLATRSPHRPAPIGLSVATLVAVRNRSLILAGLDCVHGTPVLDVKPYLPFADAPAGAFSPLWAQADGGESDDVTRSTDSRCDGDAASPPERLALLPAAFGDGGREAVAAAWVARAERAGATDAPLCDSAASFEALLLQVLSRDIRTAHARRRDGMEEGAHGERCAGEAAAGGGVGRWRCCLDGIDVGYELCGGRAVVVDARVAARGGGGEGGSEGGSSSEDGDEVDASGRDSPLHGS